MKLVWRGKFSNNAELGLSSTLPDHAIKFKEPATLGKFLMQALVFILPALALVLALSMLKTSIYGAHSVVIGKESLIGMLLATLALVPHELMHAALYPANAPVEVWYSPKHMAAFVYCLAPVSKSRFMLLGMLPNIILGLIPMVAWVFVPLHLVFLSNNLFAFALLNILSGIGDYLNVYNAYRQVPKHGIVQNSGLHSYWYTEGD